MVVGLERRVHRARVDPSGALRHVLASTWASTTRRSGCSRASTTRSSPCAGSSSSGTTSTRSCSCSCPSTGSARGPLFLLSAQVVVQASGAIAIFLLARDRIHDRWLAVALGGGPPAQPHVPVAHVGVLPSRRARDRAAAVRVLGRADPRVGSGSCCFAVLAAACKEDVALAIAVIGRADRGARQPRDRSAHARRRHRLVHDRDSRWSSRCRTGSGRSTTASSATSARTRSTWARTWPRTPGRPSSSPTEHDRVSYYQMMFAPVAFLPLLAIPHAAHRRADAGVVNIFSSFPYTRDDPVPLLVAGRSSASSWRRSRRSRGSAVKKPRARALPGGSGGRVVARGHGGVGAVADRREVPLRGLAAASGLAPAARSTTPSPRCPTARPRARSTTCSPHLAHRDEIYDFPVPWRNVNWGVDGEHLADPAARRSGSWSTGERCRPKTSRCSTASPRTSSVWSSTATTSSSPARAPAAATRVRRAAVSPGRSASVSIRPRSPS